MIKDLYKEGYTQNRELSWLRFNERCLMEATDHSVPLLERLKFVSIFSTNLDEFFMVRIGSLTDMQQFTPNRIDNKSGMTPAAQVKKAYALANKLCKKREEIYLDLKKEMKNEGIYDLSLSECTKEDRAWMRKYFKTVVQPFIGAQIVDTRHPIPTMQSAVVYTGAIMRYNGSDVFALTSVPSRLDRIVKLPDTNGMIRFVHMEDIILDNMDTLFKGAVVKEKMKFFVIRNADLSVDDDSFDDTEDYKDRMVQMLKKRKKMDVVRFVVSKKAGPTLRAYQQKYMKTKDEITYISNMPLDKKYMFDVAKLLPQEKAKKLTYPEYEPKLSPCFKYGKQKLFDQVQEKDVLLSYPYESMEPFIQLVKEAATDPQVTSIKITIYRLARKARLVDYLSLAAENGKEVDVLIELKARFDEQNNIDYSERLLDAGCNVMYGFESYKVHSKLCLITREKGKATQHVALIATGNFNENTAKQYTDLAYVTANPGIVKDAVNFFQNMMTGRLDGRYNKLIVSPVSLKQTVLKLIEREKAKGDKGVIICKLNSVTDEEIIQALHDAGKAGVNVTLLVRGICCILPEVKKKTDNIHVYSIVGRYLEHSRIYIFGKGAQEKMYISSADFMTRNTERRVEVATPILDADVKAEIHAYLDLCFADNTKRRRMDDKGKYHHIHDGKESLNSQDEMMRLTKESDEKLALQTLTNRRRGIVFDTVFDMKTGKDKKKK